MSTIRRLAGLLSSTILGAAAFPALAQVPPPSAVQAAPEGATAVGEVIVTAEKRPERLFSVPAPVSAISSARLQRQEATRLEDFAADVPGLNLISSQEGQTAIVLRGITTGSPNSSTVSSYVDDVPIGSSTGFALGGDMTVDVDPGSLQRIEVLRGPQGTLYGASSLGGLVKYVTTSPSLTQMSGRFEVDGSAVDGGGQGYGVRALVDGPIIQDQLGFSLSVTDRRDPGYIDNSQLKQTDINATNVDGARLDVLWKPTDKASLELSALMHDSYSSGTSDADVNANLALTNGLQQVRYVDEPWNIKYRIYSAKAQYDLGWANLLSITSYQPQALTGANDGTAAYGTYLGPILGVSNLGIRTSSDVNLNRTTEEVRLSSPSSNRMEWQAGLFFDHEDSSYVTQLTPFNTISGGPVALPNLAYIDEIDNYTEYAGYGDVTYHFTDKFNVLAGVRYSENHQTFVERTSGLLFGGSGALNGSSSDSSVTYLVAPQYQFDSRNMIYARIASGYQPGGPNTVSPASIAAGIPSSYRPDTLTNYELGYKASFPGQRVTVDLSVFDIEWQNVQLHEVVGGVGTIGNGGTAQSKGVEFAGTYSPIHDLSLSANLAYTDASLTADAPGIGGKSGDELPLVPHYAANINADYGFPISDGIRGFIGATLRYQGDRTSNFVTGAPLAYQRPVLPSYQTADLRVGVTRGPTELELYVKNVGDSHGLTDLTSLAIDSYSAPLTASVIQPRTFGFSVVDKF